MDKQAEVRQENKTIEQHFVRTLINDFQFAPRLAEAVLAEAQATLAPNGQGPSSGQIRMIVSQRQAGAGRSIGTTPSVEVRWTINAGAEDQEVLKRHGRVALRRVRIQRLLDEALEQGGVATQEDLAVALNVGLRTIKRDCHELEQEGVYLPTRGNLHGIGRGQTHKAQIIGRWLQGETYDQMMLSTRHSSTSIRRYVQTFVRVVELHRQDFAVSQIAHLVQSGEALIRDYLAVYAQHDTVECRTRLEEQLNRLRRGDAVPGGMKKGRAMSSQAYVGSRKRTFQQALIHELETNYGFLNSRRMLAFLVQDIEQIVAEFYPRSDYLSIGWMVFAGTQASGPKPFPGQDAHEQIAVTIAWPLLLPEDITWMSTQPDTREKRRELLQHRIVRLVEHGWHHPQGPVLLTLADLSLMLGLTTVEISALLQDARRATGKPLLTKGYFFDQGLRPTHKAEIIALYEQGMDEADIARTSNHSPTSVGRYLRDYDRVKELVKRDIPHAQISRLLGLQPSLVCAYLDLVRQYYPDLLPQPSSAQIGS